VYSRDTEDEDGKCLAAMIRDNRSIRRLKLYSNMLRFMPATLQSTQCTMDLVTDAIKSNTTLQVLSLYDLNTAHYGSG